MNEPTNSQQSTSTHESILAAAKGGGITFFGVMIEYVGRFLLGFVLARFMGDEQYGLYSLADSMVYLMIGIAPLGLVTGLLHFVPIFQSQNDEPALWKTLQMGLGAPTVVSLVIGGIFFFFAQPLAEMVFHEPRLAVLLRIVAIAVPAGTIAAVSVAITQGYKQMKYKVIAQDILLTLSKLVLSLLLAISGLNAVKSLTAYSISMVLSCLVLLYLLGRLLPRSSPPRPDFAHLGKMFKFSLPIYLAELLTIFGPNIRTILLGSLNTVRAVGIFTVAARVNMVGSAFLNSITTISMPIVSELYARREYDKLGHFYQTMTKWTLAFNLPFFIIILFFAEPILSLFGPSYVRGATGLIVLAFSNLVTAATGICGVMVIMTENVWLNTVNSALRLIFTIALSVWLIPTRGVIGAAIATALSLSIVNFILTIQVFVLFRVSPYNKNIIKPLIAGIVSGAIIGVFRVVWGVPTLIGAVVGSGMLVILYAGMMWMLGLSADDRVILSRFWGRVTRLWAAMGWVK